MGFVGVYRALYDYTPQAEGELLMKQDDLLYVLEKNGNDGWWKAKRKAGEDDEEEPIGLVPHNYVIVVESSAKARAIYEYTRQTDEELSFPEDANLEVFDTSDPDWILAGLDGEFGFVPSNYIELQEEVKAPDADILVAPPLLPSRPSAEPTLVDKDGLSTNSTSSKDASAIGSDLAQSKPNPVINSGVVYNNSITPESVHLSDGESIKSPVLPLRPPPQPQSTPRDLGGSSFENDQNSASTGNQRTPGGFHLYNINEMVSVMGKRKKMATTLGINLGIGTILIAPDRGQDDPPQEWTAEKMTHYSREGKHVFMELIRPSKSVDFHAGAKDTAEEIVAALGELAGAVRAEGLREVIMAGSQKRQKKGVVVYDFVAQGADEVTVATGDDIIIIDDTRSEEWWQVRRLNNGKEGVVPSSYIELTGTITPPNSKISATQMNIGSTSANGTVEQNRREEARTTKDAIQPDKDLQKVGPGMLLPQRGSSLVLSSDRGVVIDRSPQRNRRENGRNDGHSQSKQKAKPDVSKVRTWTDRSKSFSVEAQFLGLKDGKIHLHKMNGVKIAVPIAKMSRGDLEYVEDLTGISLDDERPLADMKKSRAIQQKSPEVGASIEKSAARPEYDWFQFFLSCDVAVGLCERYAQSFTKDSMDESVLPDVDATVLRNLGLREGDIIKVMRTLDIKFGRDRNQTLATESDKSGGLFSGPRGTLRNNTRKSRPAPAVQTSDTVDAAAFSSKEDAHDEIKKSSSSGQSPIVSPPAQVAGFDDDAWSVKPSKQEHAVSQEAVKESNNDSIGGPKSSLSESMQGLSLLTTPLQPTTLDTTIQAEQPKAVAGSIMEEVSTMPPSQQPPGANPTFFSTIPNSQEQSVSAPSINTASSPKFLAHQRPLPSISPPVQGPLGLPLPQRPVSAPQTINQQGVFPTPRLNPQITGSVQGQIAPSGQSLNDLHQARLQQYTSQLQALQPSLTGYSNPQLQGMAFSPIPTTQYLSNGLGSAPIQQTFAEPLRSISFSQLQPQSSSFQAPFPQHGYSLQVPSNINNFLPLPLEPERTGLQPLQSQTAMGTGYQPNVQTQPLLPQKTGPPPPVRFGVMGETKKLAPQPTGRRANLSQATPQNPFGF